jgi:hypothetical protein
LSQGFFLAALFGSGDVSGVEFFLDHLVAGLHPEFFWESLPQPAHVLGSCLARQFLEQRVWFWLWHLAALHLPKAERAVIARPAPGVFEASSFCPSGARLSTPKIVCFERSEPLIREPGCKVIHRRRPKVVPSYNILCLTK